MWLTAIDQMSRLSKFNAPSLSQDVATRDGVLAAWVAEQRTASQQLLVHPPPPPP